MPRSQWPRGVLLPSAAERAAMQQTLPIQRTAEPAAPRRRIELRWVGLPATIASLLVIWQAAVSVGGYRAFILPGPGLVLQRLIDAAASGLLWRHSSATLVEALGGFGIALALGLGL